MGQIVEFPKPKTAGQYADRLYTKGEAWIQQEKKILDRAEFLEAMIMVLDDVKIQNIQNRDYSMVEIITEEIAHYQQRLESTQQDLTNLRSRFNEGDLQTMTV